MAKTVFYIDENGNGSMRRVADLFPGCTDTKDLPITETHLGTIHIPKGLYPEFLHLGGGLMSHKFVDHSLQVCRVKDGTIVVTALEGDRRIMFDLTDSDRDHLCAILQAL